MQHHPKRVSCSCIQFCHYLLGRPFQLVTDHAPLQWLSEGLLCHWALAMEGYNFQIVYRKGTLWQCRCIIMPLYSISAPVAMISTTK